MPQTQTLSASLSKCCLCRRSPSILPIVLRSHASTCEDTESPPDSGTPLRRGAEKTSTQKHEKPVTCLRFSCAKSPTHLQKLRADLGKACVGCLAAASRWKLTLIHSSVLGNVSGGDFRGTRQAEETQYATLRSATASKNAETPR